MIIEMDNDRFELEITSKEYWKDLSYNERREYEDSGQFEFEGRLYYMKGDNDKVKIDDFYEEGGSKDYIIAEANNWLNRIYHKYKGE